ncbi:ATP-grasp domain-containing protein [Streptomyces sp. HNM0575]|nr:ATP-grasp domain-containing protein [Streptomyces sp. HNM0575]
MLLVGSGYRLGHERLLAQLASRASVLLLNPDPPTWERQSIADAEVFDPGDPGSLLASAGSLCSRHGADAVVSYDESHVLRAAELAEDLKLSGLPLAAARIARDKHSQRQLLAREGISPTRSTLVSSLEEGLRAAEDTGYPVIVKPRGLSGSAGVSRVDSSDGFAAAFRTAMGIDKKGMASDGILVEEYLEGEEFEVDVWTSDGTAQPVYWARKYFAYDPHPIETGYVTGAGSLDTEDPAVASGFELARRAVLAVGIDHALVHVEIKLTPRGPRVVEVNARPSGDMAAVVTELGTGQRIGSLLASAALGLPPEPAEFQQAADRAAGVKFLYPRGPQRFDGLADAERLRAEPWIVQIGELRERGTEIAPPPADFWGRAGYVMATGTSADEVDRRLTEAERELTVTGPPL